MTSPGYARGVTGLAAYLGMDPKGARKILRAVPIPKIEIPGIVRPSILFKLSEVDEALARYRVQVPIEPVDKGAGVDIDALVEEIVGPLKKGAK